MYTFVANGHSRPDAGRPRSIRGGDGAVQGSPRACGPAATPHAGPRPRLSPTLANDAAGGNRLCCTRSALPDLTLAARGRKRADEGPCRAPRRRAVPPRPRPPAPVPVPPPSRHSEDTPWLPEGKGGSGGVPLLGGGDGGCFRFFQLAFHPSATPHPGSLCPNRLISLEMEIGREIRRVRSGGRGGDRAPTAEQLVKIHRARPRAHHLHGPPPEPLRPHC